MTDLEILAPTWLEYWAVKRTIRRTRVSHTGMRLAHWSGTQRASQVIVCGLAGALAPGLCPGTIAIPDWVGLTDGSSVQCDPTLVEALAAAAQELHFQLDSRPMLTAPTLITGDARLEWYKRGFAAVDMETGLLAGQKLRVATIRVVLDSAEHDISTDWLRAKRALLQPAHWRELGWLSIAAPRYALRAARVLNEYMK
jgi:hypothetical protein